MLNMGLFSKFRGRLSGKSKKEPSSGPKQADKVSSSATEISDPVFPSITAAPASRLAKNSSVTTAIAEQHPAEQGAPSVARPVDSIPTPPPSCPAQPTASDAADISPTTDIKPWARAYEVFEERQPELAGDYKKHLDSVLNNSAAGVDLTNTQSVQRTMKQLLEVREKEKWVVPFMGKDIKIREQAERLVKFLLWFDPIVKNAVSAQPHAALAWTGVSLLLPVSVRPFRFFADAYSGSSLRAALRRMRQC
jgi:hypothetical protein